MVARQRSIQTSDQSDSEKPQRQTRVPEERYRLRVDGQLKRSFESKEPALTAGQAIKKAFPVVMVTVVDSETGATEIVPA